MIARALSRWLVALAALLLIPVGTVTAQQSDLSIDAAIGFGGLFRAGTWTPVYVTAQNIGPNFNGLIRVRVQRGARFGERRTTVTYEREMELVSGGSKAYSFVLPLQTTVYPIRISAIEGEEVQFQQDVELAGKSVPGTFVLALSRRPNLDFLLPLYNRENQRSLDVAYPLLAFLPDQWHGYDGVDLVVVHDARLSHLTANQITALRDWTAAGGRLVISAGTHYGPADAEALAQFGSFGPRGLDIATVEEAGLLEVGLPIAPAERRADLALTTFERERQGVQRISFGRGDIILLPFDYGNFVRVAPRTSIALWNSILQVGSSLQGLPTELRRRVFEIDVLANQLQLPVYRFPSRFLVGGLFASYLVAALFLLYWIKSSRSAVRRLLGIPAVIATIVAVSLSGHGALTLTMQSDETLFLSIEQAVVDGDQEFATVTRDSVIFTRGAATYEISHPGYPLVIPLDQHDQIIAREEDRLSTRVETERWGHRNAVAMNVVPLSISFAGSSGDRYNTFVIRNRSELELEEPVILVNGHPQRVGTLAPGAEIEVTQQLEQSESFEQIDWQSYVPADRLAVHRGRLLGDLARRQRFDNEESPDVILVAWPDEPLLPVGVSPEFYQDVRMNVLTMPLVLERPGEDENGDEPPETGGTP